MKKPFIYLVRKRALGDVLWIEPIIRELATRYEKVIVHTRFNELFQNFPLPNVIFKDHLNFFEKVFVRLAGWPIISNYFINLDGAYERRPNMHFLHAYQMEAGLPINDEYPRLYLNSYESDKKIITVDKYVVLHIETFSTKNYRRVYGVDWEQIILHLKENGYLIIQIGKNPVEIKDTVFVPTSIRDMITLINRSSLFIGIDSGPSHIAAALGIPSLIFFGAINADFRHFRNLFKGFIIQQACEFAGCYHEGRDKKEVDCRLVGANGIPKCSLHTNEYVLRYVTMLEEKSVENNE